MRSFGCAGSAQQCARDYNIMLELLLLALVSGEAVELSQSRAALVVWGLFGFVDFYWDKTERRRRRRQRAQRELVSMLTRLFREYVNGGGCIVQQCPDVRVWWMVRVVAFGGGFARA